MTVDDMIGVVLIREGGYTDHPADRGGPTNLGITQATLADWRKAPVTAADVEALTEKEARDIYRRRYVEDPGFMALGEPLRSIMFDSAVQHGTGAAIKMLQRALGSTVDGILGPVTLTAVQFWDARKLAVLVLAQRARVYGAIMGNDHSQAAFAKGWMARLAELLEVIA